MNTKEQNSGTDYFTAPMTKQDIGELAKMLVRRHNSINFDNASLNGERMDKALCRDTFGALYREGDYSQLQEIETLFNEAR